MMPQTLMALALMAQSSVAIELNPFQNEIIAAMENNPTVLTADCPRHLQIVHVQDSTDTFSDDIDKMIENESIKQLVEYLQTKYTKVDYTFATFHDKLRPMTGHGPSGGWWTQERWDESLSNSGSVNQCYELMGSLTNDPDEAQRMFSHISASGGKDYPENQWDALRRVTIDENVEWNLNEYDDDGIPMIRIAMMVTDDGAHTASSTFAENPRAANREWFKQSGPWHNVTSNYKQKCDIDGSRNTPNNINTAYGDLTNGRPDGADLGGDGACFGWNAQKAGSVRSLKGVLSFMEYFYGHGDDEEMIGMVECGPLLSDTNCADYWSFTHCCTPWGLTLRKGSCRDGTDHWDRFPDFQACADFGGKYARCHPSMNQQYGFTGSDDHPMSRALACTENTSEWQSVQGQEPSDAFWKGLTENNIDEIVEYPYGDNIWDTDCRSFEYPDPKDPRYAAPFIEKKIVPLILAAPPSKEFIVNPSSELFNSYDVSALRMAANNCPGLEHDPYTTYACNPNLFPDWYCYNPIDYPQLYPYERSDAALWQTDDATSWWRNRCETAECGEQWWQQCLEVEYKEPLDVIKSYGATGLYETLDADHAPHKLIASVELAIQQAINLGPDCPMSSTMPNQTTPESDESIGKDCSEEPQTKESPCSCECDSCQPCPCSCRRSHSNSQSKQPDTVLKLQDLPDFVNFVISNE